jgi:hypothetical protein
VRVHRHREGSASSGAVQLALFPDALLVPPERKQVAVDFSTDTVAQDVPEVMSGELDELPQVELFHARYVHLQQARRLVAGGKVDLACSDYARLIQVYPGDAAIADEAHGIDTLRTMFADALGMAEDARWARLLTITEQLDPKSDMLSSLRRLVLRYIANEARLMRGERVEVAGHPLAYLLVEAGLLDEAERLLSDSRQHDPCARDMFLHADLHVLRGGHGVARVLYRNALLMNPYHAYFERIRDQEVRALPEVAKYELEIEDDPRAWSAAAGMVTGVLPILPGSHEMRGAKPEPGVPASDALARARAFAAALVEAFTARARGDQHGVIAARRAMRQLAPTLFSAYLERPERGGG